MINWITNQFRKEWPIIKEASLTCIMVFCIGAVLAFLIVSWHYKERIEGYEGRIDGYKERSYELKAAGDKYTALTFEDIKTTTFKFVSKLRLFNAEWRKKESLIKPPELNNNISRSDYFRLFEEYKDKIQELRLQLQAKYFNEYKVDAMMLRDEMLSRLHKDKNDYEFRIYYEYAGDPFNMSKIPDDLERLAKMMTKIP